MDQEPSSLTDLSANVVCARCGAPFACGFTAGAAQCWCMHDSRLPALPVPDSEEAASCLCPNCLHLVQAQRADGFTEA